MANFYTSAGEALVIDFITGDDSAPADYYAAQGTGGSHSKASTTLTTESAEARVAPTETQPLADKAQWVATITSASSQTITEAGLLTASTSGTLFLVGDFAGIAVTSGDKIEFTFTHEQT